ncbi:MAG: hypothetical protein IJZ61_03870 [Oscillospiraceae bacterium]|nr:hypothetical protein [Oscillospiraceae bacterium]
MADTEIYSSQQEFSKRVRAIVRAETVQFPDDVINSFDFKGMAELNVKKNVPFWEDILNGDDTTRIDILKTCLVLETAIMVIPSLRRSDRKVEQTTNSKVEYFDNSSLDELLNQLYERLRLLYSELCGDTSTDISAPIGIALTNPHKRYFGGGFA